VTPVTDPELAWAAVLFEGEGCISSSPGRSARLQLGMTDLDVVERFHRVMGIGKVYGPYTPKTPPGAAPRKTQWTWLAGGRADVLTGLSKLLPWLGARRRAKAEEVIRSVVQRAEPRDDRPARRPSR
jgi:hypothetical protein